MLKIRREQISVFEEEAQARFEAKLVELFLKIYPRECLQAGGKEQITLAVRQGTKAAQIRGYTTKRQVSVFLSLMFILGADFANDPQLPWAAEYLDDAFIADPTNRLDYLFQETLDYLGATAGEKAEWIVRAMLRIRAYDLNDVPTTQGEQWIADVCEILKDFYPQKFEYQGLEATKAMLWYARETANAYGIQENIGLFVYASLMFMLGSGFDRDPLHPWAGKILNDTHIASEAERVERLYQAALSHIAQSLSH